MKAALQPDDIDLYIVPVPKDCSANEQGLHHLESLHSHERQRFHRLKVVAKRDEFLTSRLLLAHLINRYLNLPANRVAIVADEMGRPYWHHDGTRLPLYYSLSHTRGLVCCAVATFELLGVDVELIRPRKYLQELTAKVFSREERQEYEGCSGQEQISFFYRSWTLKEAYVKGLGKGLRIPLTSLSFTQRLNGSGESYYLPDHSDDNLPQELRWYYHSFRPADCYWAALASSHPRPRLRQFNLQLEDLVSTQQT